MNANKKIEPGKYWKVVLIYFKRHEIRILSSSIMKIFLPSHLHQNFSSLFQDEYLKKTLFLTQRRPNTNTQDI